MSDDYYSRYSRYIWQNAAEYQDKIFTLLRTTPLDTIGGTHIMMGAGYISEQGRALLILLHKLGVRP